MARLDLDNYNRNTEQGLHVTSMSGAWLNMVCGWGGLRTDGDLLSFIPSIPGKWRAFTYRLSYRGSILEVTVDRKSARFRVVSGDGIKIRVYGKVRKAVPPVLPWNCSVRNECRKQRNICISIEKQTPPARIRPRLMMLACCYSMAADGGYAQTFPFLLL